MFAEKLDMINSENRTVKNALVTAISKMTDMFINPLANQDSKPQGAAQDVQPPAGAAQEVQPQEQTRKVHKCTYNCPPYCCKRFDE